MTHPSLAGIEQRTAAATEGPWEVTQDKCWGEKYPSLNIQRVYEYTDYDLAHAGCEPLDAEDVAFIAAARTAVPALTAAVRDVLALHRAVEVEPSDTICAGCSTLRGAGESLRYFPVTEYPCATVRALAAHLDLTDPEGDPT